MTIVASLNGRQPLRTLWKRAPLWRFFALLAPFLTAIFLLFPPQGGSSITANHQAIPDQVSYTPATEPEAIGDPSREPAPVAKASVPTVAAANGAPPAVPPMHQEAPASESVSAAPAAPKTAQLSMAAPGQAVPFNGSGLDPALLGPLYSGSITSTGFTLPLPPGKWAVLARSTVKTPTASGMGYYLGRIEHKRLIGVVKFFSVRSNVSPGQGFPEAKSCAHPAAFNFYVFVEGDISPSDHQACWLVENYYSTALQYWADRAVKLPPLERAAGGDLTAKGVSYPQDLITVRFTRSDKSNFMEADYLFSPEADGITSNVASSVQDSDWTAANVHRYPEKLAYMAKMKSWGEAFWPRFKDAFSQGTTAAAP